MIEREVSPTLRSRKNALALASLFLLSQATPEITSSVWHHDLVRWQQAMDPRRRNVLGEPTALAILNRMELGHLVEARWEPLPESVDPLQLRPPRKFFRPTPSGELATLTDAIPRLAALRAAPLWLPESLHGPAPIPEDFEFTLPIGPLQKIEDYE